MTQTTDVLRQTMDQQIRGYLENLLAASWWAAPSGSGIPGDPTSRVVAGFVPDRNEPAILASLASHAGSGRLPGIGLVRVSDGLAGLTIHVWSGDREDLVQHPIYPIHEPRESLPVLSPARPCLVLVPGLAFTRTGQRLGKGGGYYDRFFAANPQYFRLGIAREAQIVDSIPVEAHDQVMDGLLTEKGFWLVPGRKGLEAGTDFYALFQYLWQQGPEADPDHQQGD